MKAALLIIRNNTLQKMYILLYYRRKTVAIALHLQFLTEKSLQIQSQLSHYPIVCR